MTVTTAVALNNASEEWVIDAGARRIGKSALSWPYLPTTSRVIDLSAYNFIQGLWDSSLATPDVQELADYLAMSTFCHLFDGWRYLSESALASIRGSRNISLHLAYYAEVRAALSILASNGVGIVNNKNFAIQASGNVDWFSGKTHEVIWKAISLWAENPFSAQKVQSCLGAYGMNVDEWAEICGGKPSVNSFVEEWLKNWSIDLKTLKQDSTYRNTVTYNIDLRAQALDGISSMWLSFVKTAPLAFSPAAPAQLGTIDLAIIHSLCVKCRDILSMGDHDFWEQVEQELVRLKGMSAADAQSLVSEVKNAHRTAGGRLIRLANKTAPISTAAVFSRALFLLRLASAIVKQQWSQMRLRATGGTISWHREVLVNYGIHSHLWERQSPPTDFFMLDQDITDAAGDVEKWQNSTSRASFSPYAMWRDMPHSLFKICQLERLGILSLAV
ncbi:MAG: hypothetical protein M1546_05630 [Chloroflexi bacterium]|nr:hypothetical protein [Chloroflexota bacterium]